MLTPIIVILVVLIAALLIYAATKPDSLTVSRSASIKASPEAIFSLINDFRRWAVWSPYEKLDPAMNRTYHGAESGRAPPMPARARARPESAAWRLPIRLLRRWLH